jgi:DNA adenine methylase
MNATMNAAMNATMNAPANAAAAAKPVRPFLKWAGGKTRLVARIKAVLPPGARLIEPFVGSAALFLNTDYPRSLLCDANPDLINLYTRLQRQGAAFIEACRACFVPENNTRDAYYALRERFNTTCDPQEKAALFVYLNKHCYNGLCRYNASGRFNVPFGRYKRPRLPADEMLAFHRKAQRAEIVCAGFEATMCAARPGDVVYCDPPYVPLSGTAHFTSYSAGKFGAAEQARLAELAALLAARGVPVVVSNHWTPATQELYRAARTEVFAVSRNISRDAWNRRPAQEVIALFGDSNGGEL